MHLVYFAPVPLHSYRQRPHFMVDALLESGEISSVTWIDPIPTRLPNWSDLRRRVSFSPSPRTQTVPRELQHLSLRALPIEPLPGGPALNLVLLASQLRSLQCLCHQQPCLLGVGRPSSLATRACKTLPVRGRFLDLMDDFPAFYHGWSQTYMNQQLRQIINNVDCIVSSSTNLKNRFGNISNTPHLSILNGYPCRNFERPTRQPHRSPTLGYIGTIAAWFDWALLIRCAQALPFAEFHLYGPVFTTVPLLPNNVTLHGAIDHQQALDVATHFDIGLIPFKINRLTDGVDPIKFYEYRLAGIPTWTSEFGEMAYRERERDVRLISLESDWNSLLKETLETDICFSPEECASAFDWHVRMKPLVDWVRQRRQSCITEA